RHAVAHAVAGGKKKNRRAHPVAAEFRDHFPAVLVWQHDIDDKKIKFGGARFLQTGLAIARNLNRKAGFPEAFREETRCFLFVLNNENPHMLDKLYRRETKETKAGDCLSKPWLSSFSFC